MVLAEPVATGADVGTVIVGGDGPDDELEPALVDGQHVSVVQQNVDDVFVVVGDRVPVPGRVTLIPAQVRLWKAYLKYKGVDKFVFLYYHIVMNEKQLGAI